MLRRSHSLLGLVLALPLVLMAVTGAILSIQPAVDHFTQPRVSAATSVADLAAAVVARHDVVDKIAVKPSGEVLVTYSDGTDRGVERVDPATGVRLGPYQPSAFNRVMIDLHRALLMGETGRYPVIAIAAVMLLLALTGLPLMARRYGGWAAVLLQPIRGTFAQRWHGELARLAVLGLLISSLSGLAMSADTFGLVTTDGVPAMATASAATPAPLATLPALRNLPLTDLREISLADPTDPTSTFDVVTANGEGEIDQATGTWLTFQPISFAGKAMELIRALHTGSLGWLADVLLGLASLSVPALGITGALIWWRRRVNGQAAVTTAAADADTIILVGSEGNATWGFARTLEAALTAAGHRVHAAPMAAVAFEHLEAERLLVLTSTSGDGDAPASASAFLARMRLLSSDRLPAVAVLGFGDRTYANFCGFAHQVAVAFHDAGWPELMPLKRIDRQSAQEFAAWGEALGERLGHPLRLEHVASQPKTVPLVLVGRDDYGAAVNAPIAILRFQAPTNGNGRRRALPTFAAGDLIGIVPPGSPMPRFYSLASSTSDGMLEICVRLRPGGVCSTYLHDLTVGDQVNGFIRDNPHFHPAKGKAPLILIGAGAGIGPLAGFVRANAPGRPVHLYWGGRSPSSDFLYEHELADHLASRTLTSLSTAFSRAGDGAYVQDRLVADAPRLRHLIGGGAQVLVCGGRDMAASVTQTLNTIIQPLGLDLGMLKTRGRYVEDVY